MFPQLTVVQAFSCLKLTSATEEAIRHAIYAIETRSHWYEGIGTTSPEQHLAESDRLLSEQRDSNVVDAGVLIGQCGSRNTSLSGRCMYTSYSDITGYGLHLIYHINMGHWATNVSLIYSIMAMASAAGLHLQPTQNRLSLWSNVPPEAHPLLARLFWIFRSWQCQMLVVRLEIFNLG